MNSILFPNLGYEFLPEKGFTVFGVTIAFYGLIIAVGMILGACLAYREAYRTGQNVDHYIDYTIFGILGAIIGARLYYVAFEWSAVTGGAEGFFGKLFAVINIRSGGLAIYGGIIGAAAVLVIFCKKYKLNVFQFLDTVVLGLIVGQIVGRWGNFFNREAFGSYTFTFLGASFDISNVGFFKKIMMLIPVSDLPSAGIYDSSMIYEEYGIKYVQALPTFFLESFGNLIILILLLIFRDKKKFYGETATRYLIGYGVLRFYLEGFRTDQLKIGSVAVSQIVSLAMVLAGVAILVIMYTRLKGKPSLVAPVPTKEELIALTKARKEAEEAARAARKSAKKTPEAENVEPESAEAANDEPESDEPAENTEADEDTAE